MSKRNYIVKIEKGYVAEFGNGGVAYCVDKEKALTFFEGVAEKVCQILNEMKIKAKVEIK